MTDPARPDHEAALQPQDTERAARARALAPAYDYIRALVARWEAEDCSSGREEQSA